MGQAESRQKNSSIAIAEDSPSYDVNSADQIHPGLEYEDEQSSGFCCVTKTRPKTFDNNKWKKMMIEHLESLEISGWPKLLSKCLKKFELGEFASVFQADVFWTYKNYQILGRKSFSIQSVLSQSQGESFLETTGQRDLNGENKSLLQPTQKNPEEIVQGLLDNTHILEEKFYNSNQRETWINKSFNIAAQEIPANVNDSFTVKQPMKRISVKEKTILRDTLQNSEYTKKHIEKYKNNTFVSQLPAVKPEDEAADDLFQKIMKYKIVTEIIEKHLKQKRNIFYHLISQFSSYFVTTYQPILKKAKSGDLSGIQDGMVTISATTDLQQFIRVIFEGLCTFYKLDCLEPADTVKDSLFNRDNLLSFTTSLIFTKEIHEIILEFYKFKEVDLEQVYQSNLKQCKQLQPQDFGVPDEYCLNEKTASYFLEKGLIDKQYLLDRSTPRCATAGQTDAAAVDYNFSLCEEGAEEESKMSQSNPQDSSKPPAGQEPLQTLEIYRNLATETRPYEEAISMLSSLKHRTSPIHKLKAIVKVAELITKSIEKFYMRYGLLNSNKLDADQTLSIFLYIVTKSGLGDLTAHCRIIEKFSTNNVLNSVSGYYATTLEACVNCINSMKFAEEATADRLSIGFKEFVSSMRVSVGRVSIPRQEIDQNEIKSS